MKALKFLPILVLAVVGCQNAQDMVDNLGASLDNEFVQYRKFQYLKDQRGEEPVEALEAWASSLKSVSQNLTNLIWYVEKYKEERATVEAVIAANESRLKQILDRDWRVRMPFVPSWRLEQVQSATQTMQKDLLQLRRDYTQLYQKTSQGEDAVVLGDFRVDLELYDTFNDCMDRIKFFGIAHNDTNCELEGRNRCGHQMDISCISKVLLLNAGNACSKAYYDANGNVSYTVSADWLDELNRCKSSSLILRHQAG
ncbi:MAG: hypothetical protein AB7F43_00405 [Bacteriovoracia bacterium]